MKTLRLPNGLLVDVQALAEAGDVDAGIVKMFLSKLPKDLPMRKISLEEQFDRATTYPQIEGFLKRLCEQRPLDKELFLHAVKKMIVLSMADLDRATTPEELREIWKRNIPGGEETAELDLKILHRLAEFFVIEE